jgi:hypothetical protein
MSAQARSTNIDDKTAPAGQVTSETVRHFFRDIEDHTVVAILNLQPSMAQLEEAAIRLAGAGEIADIHPEGGVVAQIVELVSVETNFEEDRPPHE